MEYAASLVKIKPNLKLYIRGNLLCMELTREREINTCIPITDRNDLDKIMSRIKGTPEIITTMEDNYVVVYIKDFYSDMINNVG